MNIRLVFALIVLSTLAGASCGQDLQLPVEGRWFVVQGGDTINVNHHMAVRPQWYGVDLAKVAGKTGRELSASSPVKSDDFFSWGEPVKAPVDGEVVAAVNDRPDNKLGVKDAESPAGNYVSIKAGPRRFVFLAHFQRGSIAVKPGNHVIRGQFIGRCGNSGNTDFPHVHLHVQDSEVFNSGTGQNPVFSNIDVELNGKSFEGVTWPLIRGLFIQKR